MLAMSCPLCLSADAQKSGPRGEVYNVICLVCGEYSITSEAAVDIPEGPRFAALRPALSAATRRASDAAQLIQIDRTNWRKYAESFAFLSPETKAKYFLDILRRRTRFFGEAVEFDTDSDWPLIAAQNPEECRELLNHIERTSRAAPTHDESWWKLTVEGWKETEPAAGAACGLGFVAMAFDADMEDPYEYGIRAAIETDCGLTAIRVDKQHFKEEITDRMIADIRRSEFLVADFTHQKNGVYFEAGFAMALGRLVIWCCRESDKDKLHFDTRQYPHIIWKDPADLREKLRNRLRALVPGARLGCADPTTPPPEGVSPLVSSTVACGLPGTPASPNRNPSPANPDRPDRDRGLG